MTSLLGELRRRNVFKVAMACAIAGWLLLEVASDLLPTPQAPERAMWLFSFSIVAAIPFAVVGEMAMSIAAALQTKHLPQEISRLNEAPSAGTRLDNVNRATAYGE